MKTTLSSKGQVVLPVAIRQRMGLLPGAEMKINIEGNRLVLVPLQSAPPKCKQSTNPLSGLPTLEVHDSCSPLTSSQVKELLADFP